MYSGVILVLSCDNDEVNLELGLVVYCNASGVCLSLVVDTWFQLRDMYILNLLVIRFCTDCVL